MFRMKRININVKIMYQLCKLDLMTMFRMTRLNINVKIMLPVV